MRKYRVRKELKPYVSRILTRSFYKCRMVEENNTLFCINNAGSDTFHKIVQRAKCEKKSNESGSFYVTSREAKNTMLLNSLLQQAGETSFIVIDDKLRERV